VFDFFFFYFSILIEEHSLQLPQTFNHRYGAA